MITSLYSVVNHFLNETYPCGDSIWDAKEALEIEYETLRDLGRHKGFRCEIDRKARKIVGLDGYVFAEVQRLDVDTFWDIETLVILQQANNL